MNRRLEQLYDLIPKNGRGVIDVGTDHGLIPIRLALAQYSGTLFASDVVPGPLNAARKAAENSHVEERITFLLCDGLDRCPPDRVDTIVIAGMGGDTICGILDRADWIFSTEYRLILQPMTRPEVLRYWLVHNEFRIDTEAVVQEDSHVYQMFCASLGKSEGYSDPEYMIGSCAVPRIGDSITPVIQHQLQRIQKKLTGYRAAGRTESSEYSFYDRIEQELQDLKAKVGA